ncbi:MAG: AraC family transcriptional regulator [bacterium]|nr:AraC family transcriptional regulator [bacterium]MCP4964643.1 AraC family transcriptional regulator [bacterium]
MTGSSVEASSQRPLYVERVNAVIDHIEKHLDEEMTLDELAGVAHFSPFHFHRVFGVLVGETLSRFINRLRLERAATLLVQQPSRSVTEVAGDCGLHNPSSFARSFRDLFGMTATEWRETGFHRRQPAESVRDLLGNVGVIGEDYGIAESGWDPETRSMKWDIRCADLPRTTVQVVEVPSLEVAYVRRTGRYQGLGEFFADIFSRLMTWAGPRELVNDDSWVLAVYHDNPSITDDEKLRVSACIDVPAATSAAGEIGRMRLPGGQCAVARFELGETDYSKAWFALAGGWLPDSGYEPDDRLPFERFPIGVSTTSPDKEIVDIYLPVRPLRAY